MPAVHDGALKLWQRRGIVTADKLLLARVELGELGSVLGALGKVAVGLVDLVCTPGDIREAVGHVGGDGVGKVGLGQREQF